MKTQKLSTGHSRPLNGTHHDPEWPKERARLEWIESWFKHLPDIDPAEDVSVPLTISMPMKDWLAVIEFSMASGMTLEQGASWLISQSDDLLSPNWPKKAPAPEIPSDLQQEIAKRCKKYNLSAAKLIRDALGNYIHSFDKDDKTRSDIIDDCLAEGGGK